MLYVNWWFLYFPRLQILTFNSLILWSVAFYGYFTVKHVTKKSKQESFSTVIRRVQCWDCLKFLIFLNKLWSWWASWSLDGTWADVKILVFSLQSSVLILLSSDCICGTDLACQESCKMCCDSLFLFYSIESTFWGLKYLAIN